MVEYSQEPYLDSEEEYKRYLRDLLANSGGDLTGSQTLPDGAIIGFAANDLASKQRMIAPPPQILPEQQQPQVQPLSALMAPQQQPQQSSEAFRKQQIGNGLRNETTGMQYALQSAPTVAFPSGGNVVGNLLNFGKRNNIPQNDLMAMIQYQSSAGAGSPSAEDLFMESFRFGTPVKELIAAYSTMGAGARNAEKENLALQKQRAELAQLQAKPSSEYDKAMAQERARRDIMASMPPAMREAEEVKRLGIKLKPGERYNMEKGEVELIPGSAPYKKMESEVAEKVTGLAALDRVIGRMTDIVADIEKSPGKDAAVGMWDAWAPVFASLTPQDKANARSKIKNLQEYLQTRGLADLRASGVAPGSVTEKEWGKFAAMIANIDPSMSEKEFDKELSNLKTMAASYGAEAAAKKEAYAKQYGPMWEKYASSSGAPAPAAPKLTNDDSEAIAWAMKNPNDPRAAKIKKRLGVK